MFFHHIFVLFALLFSTGNLQSSDEKMVEVFDIAQEQVILQFTADETIDKQTKELLNQIDGVFPKVQPIPKDGLMIKSPLTPGVFIENEWLTDLIDEIIIFYSAEDEPYILVFDQENRSHFFTIKDDSFCLLLDVLNRRNLEE